MRLDKFLSETGYGTRTEVKKAIQKGLVAANGVVIRDPAFHIDENKDQVEIEGKSISYTAFEYLMMNKPQGVISATRADLRHKDEVCVIDLIPEPKRKDLFPVGRLDKDTEGFLLITNDGTLSHQLLSPKKHVPKTYFFTLDRRPTEAGLREIEKGIDIGDEKPALPAEVRLSEDGLSGQITITEGRYHEVKRIFHAAGAEVTFLKRLSMGALELDEKLAPGAIRHLTDEEISLLKR